MAPYKKYAKKAKKAFTKRIVKPYTSLKNNRGYNNRMKLYKEVAMLKKVINAEKQNADIAGGPYNFAQNFAAATGTICVDMMPTISQGSSEDQRKGDSLKVSSMCFQVEIYTNSFNTLQDTRYKIYVIRQPTNPVSTATTISNFLEPNVFSGVVDFNSNRDYEHFKDFTVLGVLRGVLKQNTNGSVGQIRKNQHKLAIKCNYHVRYEKGTTNIINNPIYFLAVADSGDINGTNFITMNFSNKVYYYDN